MTAGAHEQLNPEPRFDASNRLRGDDHNPAFVATAVVQLGVADLDALNASFAAPGAAELIQRWQSRYSYKAVWANHEPLLS
ncbi:hypothetical protein ACWEKM_15175 [Streptomyces sp. NPDC004752]